MNYLDGQILIDMLTHLNDSNFDTTVRINTYYFL